MRYQRSETKQYNFILGIVDYVIGHPKLSDFYKIFNHTHTTNNLDQFYGKIYFGYCGGICTRKNGVFMLDISHDTFYITLNPIYYNYNTSDVVYSLNDLFETVNYYHSEKTKLLFNVRLTWMLLIVLLKNTKPVSCKEVSNIVTNNIEYFRNTIF